MQNFDAEYEVENQNVCYKAIPLNQAGNAYITLAPPWSKRLFKLGRLAYGPGQMPPQLEKYATDSAHRNRALARAHAVVRAAVGSKGGRRRRSSGF